jgi:ADP-ribose pyrophosphatase
MPREFSIVKQKVTLRSRIFHVRHEHWRGPGARRFERDTIIHPGAVAILPFDARGRVLMLRQFRPAVKEWLLEIPAGTLEPGEPLLACAKRELIEETGFAARRWAKLGFIYNAPGYSNERIVLYKAWDLKPAYAAQDADEHIELAVMSMPAIRRAVRSGRICDAKTLCALHLADAR